MAGFISALIKQRRDAKKAGPDTGGRLKEIVDIIRKYDYDDGITPEIVVGIIQDLGPTFGMMGLLSQQQRQILLDLVTAIVMQDAYALKRTVLKAATPQGDIDHGAMLQLCEDMCGQYTGSDFGDFELGDLLGTVIGNLQDENYKIDPFLTNLARVIIAVEGTVKTLSPRVNILNYFVDKVDMPSLGFDKDGHLASIHEVIEYTSSSTDSTYELSDFDSTVVEEMPKADKTFEEMEEDIEAKLEAFEEELDVTSEYQDKAKE